MGKCPNCGNSGMFLKTAKCVICGRECCKKCSKEILKLAIEGEKRVCSNECFKKFEDRVLEDPSLKEIGTDFRSFNELYRGRFVIALGHALSNGDFSKKLKIVDEIVKQNPLLEFTYLYKLDVKYKKHALQLLADNIKAAGRLADAAEIYEQLGMYDEARELRSRERQVIVKNLDVSVNINQLLQQVKDGGIVAVYRCPHCGGKLTIDGNTNVDRLRRCNYCSQEIETVDLAEFLKTALS
jgi:DNA-directed RNA polymerase subunit RPC12/RpoP